jgi:high affinity Mn2+ porin
MTRMKTDARRLGCIALACGWILQGQALAQATAADSPAPDSAPQAFALHVQATVTLQAHPAFTSPYRGPFSLDPGARADETTDFTVYAGARLWSGAEFWVTPEIDQGFGLSDTVGIAGFPSGEAYKVGARDPYLKLQRAFLRQTFNLGGAVQTVDPDLFTLGGSRTADRLVITVGKVSTVDIFDNNAYAHDPRQDFLNWTLIDTGSFDYAADAWGYTVGAAGEWYAGPWAVRAGVFDLSVVPNSAALDPKLDQYQDVAEIERRYSLWGEAGKAAVTGFLTRGRQASFADAVALSLETGEPANVVLVRHYRSRGGLSVNMEQAINDQLGLFLRAGGADGNVEPYEFTDVDDTFAMGASQGGKPWGRADDKVGLAFVVNTISKAHEAYLNAGGTGILVGDGQLPHPGPETSIETFYSLAMWSHMHLSADYQFVHNPAYNRDRGPVSVLGLRLHAQY